jgi:hypothetical protein
MRDTAYKAYNEGRRQDAHRLLLEDYAKKPVRRVIQIDGFETEGDSVMEPDEDGHCLMGGNGSLVLQRVGATEGLPVRVQIHEDANKEDVLLLLEKISDLVERYFHDMQLETKRVEDPEDFVPF